MERIPTDLTGFLRYFLKPYHKYLFLLLTFGIVWGAYNAIAPYITKLIIDSLTENQADKSAAFKTVMLLASLYIGLWLIIATNFRLRDYVLLKLHPALRKDITSKLYSYLNRHSFSYFQNNFAGSLTNKINDMSGGVITILTRADDTIAVMLAILIAIITMLFISPVFALILTLWVASFAFITWHYSKGIEKLSEVFADSKTLLTGKIVDSISNVANIHLFARNKYENELIDKSIDDSVIKDKSLQAYALKMRIWWDISIIVMIALIIFSLIYLYFEGKATVGDFSFIISITISLMQNLWFIASNLVQFSEESGKCIQALSLITEPHKIKSKENAQPLVISKATIEFKDVCFGYDKINPIFKDKNIMIESGQKVGLVGFSGSGKSSFINLILRFFEANSGQILIGGKDIKEVTLESLRENIAMIPQDTSMFHRSLMENIRYGNINATDDEVIEASKKAHCHEFVKRLEHGYNTLVGERGIKLSGGQRQRIAIARAILKNAPILILDEATSALDSVTEKFIQKSLNELMKNKTTIVVAHRLSTLSEMDRIIVFDKGKIVEDGNHKSLLRNNGHYAKMWLMQAGGFLPEDDGSKAS